MKQYEGVEVRSKAIRIVFQCRGKRCRETLKGWAVSPSNLKKAAQFRAAVISEISSGKFDYSERFPNSKNALSKKDSDSVSVLQSNWINIKAIEVSDTTLPGYKTAMKLLLSYTGETSVKSISHNVLLDLRRNMLITLSANTVNKMMTVIRMFFSYCQSSNIIEKNPAHGITSLNIEKAEPDPLEICEFQRLIAHGTDIEMCFWIVAAYTGMRIGELCALAWEDVDLTASTITVRRNRSANDLRCTKTKAGERTIQLLSPALDALIEQRERTCLQHEKKVKIRLREFNKYRIETLRWVFPTLTHYRRGAIKSDHECMSKGAVAHSWKKLMKLSGVRYRVPYQIRHTFACWMITNNANINWLAKTMGHTNSNVTLNVYGKFMDSSSALHVAELNDRIAPPRPQKKTKHL